MKQVLQDFRSGALLVEEIPLPSVGTGFVLVQTAYSVISRGTERATVGAGRASLLGKARQRPDLVKQVIATLQTEGLAQTIKRVRTKLETLKELGYSSSGTVLMSMDTDAAFRPGDRVACAGAGYASHASIVSVPQNLLVKIPEAVSFQSAAFTTLGAVALQGVRQANPRLGEFICVIGLGLIGQITAQILRANGCHVFGVDTAEEMVLLAREIKTGCHRAMLRTDASLDREMHSFTEGHGFDAVIVTAATRANDPIELSVAAARKKGLVVIVGAVPMNIPREPDFYRKELDLRISCSYGPGRYDRRFEEEGQDYPYAYVRWTEKQNLAAFVRLLENGSVDVQSLITHVFDVDDADEAYRLVGDEQKSPSLAVLLKYRDESYEPRFVTSQARQVSAEGLGIAFIGAGSFAQKHLIPYASAAGRLQLVVTSRGSTAKTVGERFKFAAYSTDWNAALADPEVDVVFIATRHDLHAQLAIAALEAGKDVFVEKPLAIEEDDVDRILNCVHRHPCSRLMVGFNRRFAPLATAANEFFAELSEPLLINYRVNSGFVAKDHWTQGAEGGGRIIGEVCHFVDFLQFLTSSTPTRVFAETTASDNSQLSNNDTVAITVCFENGSVGIISYVATGERQLGKERIEIFGGGSTFVINDFVTGERYRRGSRRILRMRGKGHREEVSNFLNCLEQGSCLPVSIESIYYTSLTTFRIIDSLRTGLPQEVKVWSQRHRDRLETA